jgi:hypothetical protein
VDVFVEERGAIVLCLCAACQPNLTIVPERREPLQR